MSNADTLTFRYIFNLETGETLEHEVQVDKKTITSHVDVPKKIPDWAMLENNQCGNCTLKGTDYCPIAVRLIAPINTFHTLTSHCKAHVSVVTNERTYAKDTDVQDGLRSLFGLIMATSGCPSMEAFRPMALHHLPFASVSETTYRIISLYLIKRFIEYKGKTSMPISIDEVDSIYDKIDGVNAGIRARLSQCVKNDSTLNALVILGSVASLVPFKLEQTLNDLGLN